MDQIYIQKESIDKRKELQDTTGVSADARFLQLTNNLTERVKELNCLYGISRLFENENLTIDYILQGVIDFVPPAWQYPEITCARIKLKNSEFKTTNFQETDWNQRQSIVVNGKRFGSIEVYYLAQRPEADEGPFLKEERNLIYVIAERLGHTIGRKIAEDNVKLLYQRERELREKLQTEMRIRVDFTRKLIHELKTPLTSLIATSQLLCDEMKDDKYGKLARYIWDSADNLNKRIEELHDVIRGEIGTLKLSLKPVNFEKILTLLVEETRALSQQCGVSIRMQYDENIPETYADPDRIRQIVLNLINNALKYAREGKRILILASRNPDELQIEVRDYGPGVPAQRQKTLFEPVYQLEHPEEQVGGLGIGLALCRTLVELHRGRIWYKNREGKGSSFFFSIPLKAASTRSSLQKVESR